MAKPKRKSVKHHLITHSRHLLRITSLILIAACAIGLGVYYGSYYADVAIRADIYAEQAKKDKEFQDWQEKMIKKYEDENPDSKVLPQDKGGDAIPMKLTISD